MPNCISSLPKWSSYIDGVVYGVIYEGVAPLGKIELILVEKVEELTLYLIEINKSNAILKQEIELLKIQNELLQQNMDAKK